MNVTLPVSSSVEAVDFTPLLPDDIKKLSVKRIVNPVTLDTMLQPTAGGLYDLAMGAFQDNPCATCHLNKHSCPGHCGHIELPFPVYHPVYIEQLFRLLKAQCAFCQRLRASRVEINKHWCKLQLLRHGLLKAANEIDDVDDATSSGSALAADADTDDENGSEPDAQSGELMERRRAYVRAKLREAGIDSKSQLYRGDQTEAIAEARKATIQDFLVTISRTKKCTKCLGFSPKYRKNKATSIFRKPLSLKDRAWNTQNGLRMIENPLESFNKIQKAQKKKMDKLKAQRAADAHADEAVADMDISSQDEADTEIRILDAPVDEDSEEASDEEMTDAPAAEGSLTATEAGVGQTKKKKSAKSEDSQRYLSSSEIYASLAHLFRLEREILSQIYGSATVGNEPSPPTADMFFITNLVVPPNKYRREQGATGEMTEAADNAAYRSVLASCQEISEIQRELHGEKIAGYTGRSRNFEDFQNAGIRLQDHVNSIIDKDKNPTTGAAAQRNPDGVKQKLEKKEGMFRMNIMGKRVNFAARSVISPDPNIESNEIGVPPVFAMRLTYPEPVTEWNEEDLKQSVRNGPDSLNGAAFIETETGQMINLRYKNREEREGEANLLRAPSSTTMAGNRSKRVHRHLRNGDMLIMNRQPTLHKPSMMCHRARILPGEKTIRMHYANCKTYNADFDGDEMNMHFPQNELARAEAELIADNDHQYLSATAGEPLRGLIQDHISISVHLTSLDCFFNREEYQELLYSCLRPEDGHTTGERIKLLDPDIMKPVERWTGKQIVSSILLNILPKDFKPLELLSKPSLQKVWGPDSEEYLVRVQDGLLLTGILDKKQIGPSAGGLFHAVYETYGETVCGKLISILGRVLTRMLNVRAFSCGVEDLLLTAEGDRRRSEKLREAGGIGLKAAAEFVKMEDRKPIARDKELLKRLEDVLRHDDHQAALDMSTNAAAQKLTSAISEMCMPDGLVKPFPRNQMQVMTNSGAKGSRVNANLISCNLGQQVLEGRRVPVMVSGKTLPSFRAFDPNIRAGGYITDRFLTGVRPQEYYFHAMAGREGLIDTAVKTSRSGYLQRCLVKGLEGLRAEHDGSVRDSDGTMVQTLYGEDGLDIIQQAALTDFKHQTDNFTSSTRNLKMYVRSSLIMHTFDEMLDKQKAVLKGLKHAIKNDVETDVLPVISEFPPSAHVGATSEKFWNEAKAFWDANKGRLRAYGMHRGQYEKFVAFNYMRAAVQAGEPVGVVAGQSLGEPSTQMTLNTFHLAGHAAKNVTLGIPRLREILMTASMTIKTPTMNLYPIEQFTVEDSTKFAKGISRLGLAEVIDATSVTSRFGEGKYGDSRIYDVLLKLFPGSEYVETYNIKVADVVRALELKFFPALRRMINAEIRKRGEEKSLGSGVRSDAQPEVGVAKRQRKDEQGPQSADNEGGDSDDDDGGDDDATNAKSRANRNDENDFDEPDEDEVEIARETDESGESESEEDETYGGSPRPRAGGDSDEDEEKKNEAKASTKEREQRILNKFPEMTAFNFDDATGASCKFTLGYPRSTAKLLLLSLVKKAAHEALIQSIPGIASATVVQPEAANKAKGQREHVMVEGVNLVAMREYSHCHDPHRMTTNDIGAMLQHYGVEACRSTIVQELDGVFRGHAIDVNARHLTLVADYMTRGGGFSPFNRTGMRDKPAPFMKMSFETTFGVLAQAVFDGDRDRLDSPSSRITMGKVGRMGTGMVDVLLPV